MTTTFQGQLSPVSSSFHDGLMKDTGHSSGTYIIIFQKYAQDTSFLTFLLQWLTVLQSTSSKHCMAPL